MSLLSRLGAMLRGAALPAPRPASTWSSLTWLLSSPINTAPIRTAEEKLQSNVGWAYNAINRIGLDLRAAPRKVWKRTGKKQDDWEEDESVAAHGVFTRPNAMQTMGEFIQTTGMHLDLTGEAFWHMIGGTGRSAKIDGLQLVYPHWVDDPVLDERGILTGWRITIPGRSYYVVPATDMVHIKYPHPLDPLRGMSPVEAYAITHDMDIYTRAYAASLLRNRATPELVITTDQQLTPEQASLIREGWMDKHRDPAGGPAVIGSGTKVQQLGLSIADLKFIELTNASREMILSAYGVPAAIIGLTTDFNRANADTARATYQENCLLPRLDLIEEAWNTQVMPRLLGRDADRFWWGFESPVTEDRDFALRQADIMFSRGAITMNEYRERQGYDNTGTDGDVYFLPMGVNVVSDIGIVTDMEDEPLPELPALPGETPPPPPPPANDDDPLADEDEEEDPVATATARIMGRLEPLIANLPAVIPQETAAAGPDKMLALKMRAAKAEFLERQGRLERTLKSEVRKLFNKEQAALIARLNKEGARGAEHIRAITQDVEAETRDWTDEELEESAEGWSDTLREFIVRGTREGWILLAEDVGQSISWDLYRPEAERFARLISSAKVTQIRDTTRKGVRKIIGDGIAEGKSIRDMSDDLRRLYDGFKGMRAEVISRTETAASVNYGKQAHAEEIEERLDLRLVKTWVAVQDERTRDSHVQADGQTVGLADKFQIGSAFLDQPGDPMGPPEETIQCRCTCTFGEAE